MTLLDQIERLLPADAPGIGTSEAHRRLGLWAPSTVNMALRALAAQRRAASALSYDNRSYPVRRYWRRPQ